MMQNTDKKQKGRSRRNTEKKKRFCVGTLIEPGIKTARKHILRMGMRPEGDRKAKVAYGLAAAGLLAVSLFAGTLCLGNGIWPSQGKDRAVIQTQKSAGASVSVQAETEETQQELYLSDAVKNEDGSQAEGRAVSADEEPQIDQLDSSLTTASGFTDVNDQVVILENGVNLRADSQTESRIIVQLPAGTVLERTGEDGEWSRVLYEGETGYVSSQFVKVQEQTEIAEAPVPEANAPKDAAAGGEGAVVAASDGTVIPVSNGRVVVLDPGHQGKENTSKEPTGPNSPSERQKMPAGASGTVLGVKECDITLSIAKKAREILEERGYTVVMTRESNDVNLSCADRARIANKNEAGALVHIHAHSQESTSVSGVLATCQSSGNPYNSGVYSDSYALSRSLSASVSQATGARNRGVQQTDTLSEINWSQVPVTVLEVGFLSNQQEELLLSQEEYQERVALGIADGLDQFFASAR